MKLLIFSDPHFTDRPQDAYRWQVVPFLQKLALEVGGVDGTACLGDLTEFKDNHSSRLLHLVKQAIQNLPGVYKILLKGNHDYVEEEQPFFDWLGELGVTYASKPRLWESGEGEILLLPHTRNPQNDWKDWDSFSAQDTRLVLAHLTVDGAQAESGQRLPGLPSRDVPGQKEGILAISGDIHKPQQVSSSFLYVGTPYSTRFSSYYQPRVLLLSWSGSQKVTVTSYPTNLKKKVAIRTSTENSAGVLHDIADFLPGDSVRVSVEVERGVSASEWKGLLEYWTRALASVIEKGVEVSIVPLVTSNDGPTQYFDGEHRIARTDGDLLDDYCKAQNIPDECRDLGRNYVRRGA